MKIVKGKDDGFMYQLIANFIFPSGFRFESRIGNLGTAIYFAKTFSCSVLVIAVILGD